MFRLKAVLPGLAGKRIHRLAASKTENQAECKDDAEEFLPAYEDETGGHRLLPQAAAGEVPQFQGQQQIAGNTTDYIPSGTLRQFNQRCIALGLRLCPFNITLHMEIGTAYGLVFSQQKQGRVPFQGRVKLSRVLQ